VGCGAWRVWWGVVRGVSGGAWRAPPLHLDGVHAILINERGAEQKMVEMLTRRSIRVTRLMANQSGGRDDRQLLLLPPLSAADAAPAEAAKEETFLDLKAGLGSKTNNWGDDDDDDDDAFFGGGPAFGGGSADADGAAGEPDASSAAPTTREGVFPNVPYEENKYA
jgi:hypothetical protein